MQLKVAGARDELCLFSPIEGGMHHSNCSIFICKNCFHILSFSLPTIYATIYRCTNFLFNENMDTVIIQHIHTYGRRSRGTAPPNLGKQQMTFTNDNLDNVYDKVDVCQHLSRFYLNGQVQVHSSSHS